MLNTDKLTPSESEIALRAYEIWEAEGKPHGGDFDHWLKAKTELAGSKPTANSATAGKFVASKS